MAISNGRSWDTRRERLSGRYTTCLDEILKVKAREKSFVVRNEGEV